MSLKNKHTLLLVDDERAITRSLNRLFRKDGYHILTAESGAEGLEILEQCDRQVSMIISDQRMPKMNGARFLEKAKQIFPDAIRYLLTGYSDLEAVVQAVNEGEIQRYLTKPWNDEDLLLQVRQSLEHVELTRENKRLMALTIEQNKKLGEMNKNLEKKVQERTRDVVQRNEALLTINRMLEKSFMDSIRLLVSLVETLNPRLSRQMRQVAALARLTAQEMAIADDQCDKIEMAGMIHDIGLVGVEDDLWCKQIKNMKEEQLRLFNEHPIVGSIILENVEKMADVGEIVLYHHEYMNGKGFPNGLKGDQIPIGSRIVLAASDYCRIVAVWPRDMRKLVRYTRKHFDANVWKTFTVSDDPEAIIEEAAEKKLIMGAKRKYDTDVVAALFKAVRRSKNLDPTHHLPLSEVEAGMALMEDLRMKDGRLLLGKGTRLKAASVQSIKSIGERGLIPDRITVSVPAGN